MTCHRRAAPSTSNFAANAAPIAGTDFFLEHGRLDLDESATDIDGDAILRIFGSIALHGYKLSQNAEDRIAESLPVLAVQMPEGPFLWNCLREVLLGPYAAHALRTMHALGILELLIPEFHGIDSLVIRDSYHRYTVDEHTFLVIDNVHHAAPAASRLGKTLRDFAAGNRTPRSVLPRGAPARYRQSAARRQTMPIRASNWRKASLPAWNSIRRSAKSSAASFAITWKCRLPCAAIFSRPKTIRTFAEKIGIAIAAQDADPDDLRRHQVGGARRADAVEG